LMYTSADIREVHLEITQRCQAACPMCDRNENGGKDNIHITNAELSVDDVKTIFSPEFIAQLDTMYMCGNLGDPIVARDTLEVFEYFRACNPTMWLSMNTNAGAKSTDWWRKLAGVINNKGAVIFSVDGLEDTNHLYRQNVVWANVERNMRAFIDAGGRARWDFLIFQHNEHQIDEAEQLAHSWGVERFQKKKSARFISSITNKAKEYHQAKNRKGALTATIAKPKGLDNQNLILQKQKQIEKDYGSMRDFYNECGVACKVAKTRSIFITAEGLFMPCCWTAGRMYKWWHKDHRVEQIWDFIEAAGGKASLNVVENDLCAVIDGPMVGDITSSWNKSGINNGKLGVCAQKCSVGFDVFQAQFE
jgi:MoaA/NifB/PqqE/SkfB family radical SAM enzyme